MKNTSLNELAVALCQIDVAALDPAANREKIFRIAQEESCGQSHLVVFPELCLTGYVEPLMPGMEIPQGRDFSEFTEEFHKCAEGTDGPTVTGLVEIAAENNAWFVIGMALHDTAIDGKLTNSSLLIGPQGVVLRYDKVHLWQNEKLFFCNGNQFPVANLDFGKIGMQVCYDIRFPEATRTLVLAGATIVTNIWASFRGQERQVPDINHFRYRAYTRAQENGIFFLSCNRVGSQNGHRFMGHSVICGPDGTILAEAAHEEETVLRATLNLDEIKSYRSFVNLLNDRCPGAYHISS